MRYFGGFDFDEIATILQISRTNAFRDSMNGRLHERGFTTKFCKVEIFENPALLFREINAETCKWGVNC